MQPSIGGRVTSHYALHHYITRYIRPSLRPGVRPSVCLSNVHHYLEDGKLYNFTTGKLYRLPTMLATINVVCGRRTVN